jgi:hypothetical protein
MLFPTIGSIHALSFMETSISIDAIYIKIIQLKEKTLFQISSFTVLLCSFYSRTFSNLI